MPAEIHVINRIITWRIGVSDPSSAVLYGKKPAILLAIATRLGLRAHVGEMAMPEETTPEPRLSDSAILLIEHYIEELEEKRTTRRRNWIITLSGIGILGLSAGAWILQSYIADTLGRARETAYAQAKDAVQVSINQDSFRVAVRTMQQEAVAAMNSATAERQTLLTQIAELRAEAGRLRQGITPPPTPSTTPPAVSPAPSSGLPRQAVLAFLPPDANRRCPEGWTPLTEAEGRFILGADPGGGITPLQLGGEKTPRLAFNAELPQDPRRASDINWGTTPWAPGPNPARGSGTVSGQTSPVPLPPFIALTFCKQTEPKGSN
jgi:hypothetical protein